MFLKISVRKPYPQVQEGSSTSLLHKKEQFSLYLMRLCQKIWHLWPHFPLHALFPLFFFQYLILLASLTAGAVPLLFLYRHLFSGPLILLRRAGWIGFCFRLLFPFLSLPHNLTYIHHLSCQMFIILHAQPTFYPKF